MTIKKEAGLNVGEKLVEVEIETGTGNNPVTRLRTSKAKGLCDLNIPNCKLKISLENFIALARGRR